MSNIDFKKEFSELYAAEEGVVERVETVYTGYIMLDGRGDANNNKAFGQAIDALFAVAHAAKVAIKNGQLGVDFSVMPLEALWWIDNTDTKRRKQSKYCWRLMVMQPEYVSEVLIEQCIEQVKKKKKLPILDRMRFDYMEESYAVQTLGKGVFDNRGLAIQNLRQYIEHCEMEPVGHRHEVYLSDVRRGGVDKWKTIIRQNVTAFTDIEPPPPVTITIEDDARGQNHHKQSEQHTSSPQQNETAVPVPAGDDSGDGSGKGGETSEDEAPVVKRQRRTYKPRKNGNASGRNTRNGRRTGENKTAESNATPSATTAESPKDSTPPSPPPSPDAPDSIT